MVIPDLVDVATAYASAGRVSTIGVVVDQFPIKASRGESKIKTFEIKDKQFDLPPWNGSLKVRFFKDNDSDLPDVREDDVFLVRNIGISEWNGKPIAMASHRDKVPWIIFRAEDDPSRSPTIIQGPNKFTPTRMEKSQVDALLDHVLSNKQPTAPQQKQRAGRTKQSSTVVVASLPTPKKNRVCLIKDIECHKFCELVAQVVKKHFHKYDEDKCTLWVTDYTSNESLPDHEKNNTDGTEGDRYGHLTKYDWPGPWGKQTLQVTLWNPHVSYARDKVEVGDIVHLSYVHPKDNRSGDLEASVHEDKKFYHKVHIKTVSADYNTHAQELMKRRKEYWSVHGERKESSKSAKKKKTEEVKKTQEAKKAQHTEENQTSMRPPALVTSSRAKNSSIRMRDYGTPNTSIDEILSAPKHTISLPHGLSYKVPFQNVGYTLTCRVVDFYPPKLEDFSKMIYSKSVVDDAGHWEWEWRFCLLVEGIEPLLSKTQRRERMKIFVTGQDAEHLLSLSGPATDLRLDHNLLAELREKLFILWGNLEEAKQANGDKALQDRAKELVNLSSLPFECCILEYGVPCLHSQDTDAMAVDGELCVKEGCFGWERRFSIYGTTISGGN